MTTKFWACRSQKADVMFEVVNYNISEIIALISHLWESEKKNRDRV